MLMEFALLDANEARLVLGMLESVSPGRPFVTRYEVMRLFSAARYALESSPETNKRVTAGRGETTPVVVAFGWLEGGCCGGGEEGEDMEGEKKSVIRQ